jgi:hypothetical protein
VAIPEPFTPVALTAGILASLATDILKYGAQALDSTQAGWVLKQAGPRQTDWRIEDLDLD